MSGESDSEPEASPLGGLWLAGLLFVLLTLAVWVFAYEFYGPRGALDQNETGVVALVLAVVVFGGRWCILRFARKPKTSVKGSEK